MMVMVDTKGVDFNWLTVSPPKVGSTRCKACGSQMRRSRVKGDIPMAFAASSWPCGTPLNAPRITSPS